MNKTKKPRNFLVPIIKNLKNKVVKDKKKEDSKKKCRKPIKE